ncbi:MAG: 4'-phosphopantetheinyl transferase superfamily protein [Mucilaginibacter sp.]
MKSTGNDIVALNAIDIRRTKSSRFYSKFLNVAEQALYQQTQADIPFEKFVWLLWSVKEAAYKYYKRHDAGLMFSPIKFVVQQVNFPAGHALTPFTGIYWDSEHNTENYITGSIVYGSEQLYFRAKLHPELITTVVSQDEQFENVYWGFQLVEHTDHEHQSREAIAFSLIKLSSVLGIADLNIAKSEIGYPVVLDGGTPLDVALSFAHHERFVGYSFAL